MEIKKGKKETINRGKSIVTIGTVDKTVNKSAYMLVSFWVRPHKDLSFSKFNRILSRNMSDSLSPVFGTAKIVDVVCKETSFDSNKESFITISSTIYSKQSFSDVKKGLISACDTFNEKMSEIDGSVIDIAESK